jgi:ubiquinone/menaquinone biosynthesis C-methylase UbiE
MEPRLQRRVQRYGWDLAANDYDALWQAQLAPARAGLLAAVPLAPGDKVLDVACGTGLVSLQAARSVGPSGRVLGIDLSGQMVEVATRRATSCGLANVDFARMGGEALEMPDESFDAALCALGLMYMPDPAQALREMRRVLRPGGRLGLAVWGERTRCGWSAVFPIVDAEVASEVCPLFFSLGEEGVLAGLCEKAGFRAVTRQHMQGTLAYANADQACDAAFVGGPVALAWARFEQEKRKRVRARYLESIASWRDGRAYRVPAEFVLVSALR